METDLKKETTAGEEKPAVKGMDLSALAPETVDLEITNPATGDLMGFRLQIVSLDHPDVKAVERVLKNRALKSRAKSVTAEQLDDNRNELLAATIKGWQWHSGGNWNGKELPFTKENVLAIVAHPVVRKQIDELLDDDAVFYQA